MNKDELAELQKTTLEMVRQTTAEVVKPISDILGRLSSSVDSIVEENTIDMMLMTAVFHAAVNSGLIEVKDKEDDLKQRSQFFESIQRELTTKKRFSGVSLENLIEEGLERLEKDGVIDYVLREKSRLYKLVKLIQSKPYKANFTPPKCVYVTTTKTIGLLKDKKKYKEMLDDGKWHPITVSGDREKESVQDMIQLSLPQGEKVTNSLLFPNEYYAAVHDAAAAYYESWELNGCLGECVIPLAELNKHITHNENQLKEDKEKELAKIIDTLRSIDISLDFTKSAVMHHLPQGCYIEKKTRALNADYVFRNINGNLVTCIRIFSKPILWKQAVLLKQYFKIEESDYVIMDKGKALSMTNTRVCAIRWLMRRLWQLNQAYNQARDSLVKYQRRQERKPELELPDKTLKECISGKKRHSEDWLMDTLFEACEVTSIDLKTDLCHFVIKVLEQWKKSGRIVDFKKLKKGSVVKPKKGQRAQSFDAVRVFITQPKQDSDE